LEEVALSSFAQAFDDKSIGFSAAQRFTDEQLINLGLTAMGDRKRLLKVIADEQLRYEAVMQLHEVAQGAKAGSSSLEILQPEVDKAYALELQNLMVGKTLLRQMEAAIAKLKGAADKPPSRDNRPESPESTQCPTDSSLEDMAETVKRQAGEVEAMLPEHKFWAADERERVKDMLVEVENKLKEIDGFRDLLPVMRMLRDLELSGQDLPSVQEKFLENKISMDAAKELNDEDLRQLGLRDVGLLRFKFRVHGRRPSHQRLAEVLEQAELKRYVTWFDNLDIGLSKALDLKDKDLRQASDGYPNGISAMGDRKRILTLIAGEQRWSEAFVALNKATAEDPMARDSNVLRAAIEEAKAVGLPHSVIEHAEQKLQETPEAPPPPPVVEEPAPQHDVDPLTGLPIGASECPKSARDIVDPLTGEPIVEAEASLDAEMDALQHDQEVEQPPDEAPQPEEEAAEAEDSDGGVKGKQGKAKKKGKKTEEVADDEEAPPEEAEEVEATGKKAKAKAKKKGKKGKVEHEVEEGEGEVAADVDAPEGDEEAPAEEEEEEKPKKKGKAKKKAKKVTEEEADEEAVPEEPPAEEEEEEEVKPKKKGKGGKKKKGGE